MLTSTRSRRMPALLTRMSRSPNASIAVLTRRWAPSQSAMSSPLATASPPRGLDLGDDLVGRAVVGAGAVVGAAAVVDDDLGALGGEQQGVLAPEAAPGTGDDRHAPVESSHRPRPFVARRQPSQPRRRDRHRTAVSVGDGQKNDQVDGGAAAELVAGRRPARRRRCADDERCPGSMPSSEPTLQAGGGRASPAPGRASGRSRSGIVTRSTPFDGHERHGRAPRRPAVAGGRGRRTRRCRSGSSSLNTGSATAATSWIACELRPSPRRR